MSATKPLGFWGLVVEPDRMYSQVVPVSFKVTMATLGPDALSKNGKESRSTLKLTHDKDGEFSLCTLQAELQPNQPLDLVFLEGETIHFRVEGGNAVHLTGYYFEESGEVGVDGGYDSEELEAEMNGESLSECTESECEGCDGSEEGNVDKYDTDDSFINDDEEEEEEGESDEDDEEEVVGRHRKRTIKSTPRIKEVIDEEEEEDSEFDEEEDSDIDVDEDSEEYDEDEISDDDDDDDEEEEDDDDESEDNDEEDEEIDSDDAGSVDLSPGKKKKPTASNAILNKEPSKRAKVEQEVKQPSQIKGKNDKQQPQQQKQQEQQEQQENKKPQQPAKQNDQKPAKKDAKTPVTSATSTPQSQAKTLAGGLKIEDLKVGAGIKAQKGRKVTISYAVDGQTTPSKSVTFELTDTTIAKGLLLGVQGMALGGERKLVIPSSLISEDSKPSLPRDNSFCTLTVKLEQVQNPTPKQQQ